jgi:hypothetical protein
VTYAVIEDLKLALSRKAAHPRNRDGKKPKYRPRVRNLERQEPSPRSRRSRSTRLDGSPADAGDRAQAG